MVRCPYCDRHADELLTRVAVLSLRFRKTAVAVHELLGHEAADWQQCGQAPCVANKAALRYGTLVPEEETEWKTSSSQTVKGK